MADPVLNQNAGLQQALQRLTLEKEQYVRLCVILTRVVRGDIEGLNFSEDGQTVLIEKGMYDEVPAHFTINVAPVRLQENREPAEGEDEVPLEELIAVIVERKQGANGSVAVAEAPRLVLP